MKKNHNLMFLFIKQNNAICKASQMRCQNYNSYNQSTKELISLVTFTIR